MIVTKVSIEKLSLKDSGICAEASVVLDDSLVVHKVFVIKGERGYFVSMPNTGQTKLIKNQKRYIDIVHPITKELDEEIKSAVMEQFKRCLSDS